MRGVGAAASTGSSQVDGSAGAGIGVTICCAFSDLAAMQKLGALLRERDIAVEMLPGVERDANALQMQLASDAGPTIYVIANGHGLNADKLNALVQLFATERGPAHRLLVLDVDHEDPSRMVLPVVRAHDAMRKHRSSGELPRRQTKRGMERPTATPSSPRSRDSDPVTRDTQRRGSEPQGVDLDLAASEDVDVRGPGATLDDALGIDLPPSDEVESARRSSTEYGGPTMRRRSSREVIRLPTRRRPGSSQDIPRVDDSGARARRPGSSQDIPRLVDDARPRSRTPPGGARVEEPVRRTTPPIGTPVDVLPRRTPPVGLGAQDVTRRPTPFVGSPVIDAPRRTTPPSGARVDELREAAARPRRRPQKIPIPQPQRRAGGLGQLVEVLPPRDERASSETPIMGPKTAPVPAARRKPPLKLLAIGGIAVVATAAVFAFAPSNDDDGATQQRGIAASATAKPEAAPKPAPPPTNQAEATKTDATKHEATKRDATKSDATTPEPTKPRIDPSELANDRIEDAQSIAAALDARHIHALDALLFVVPAGLEQPLDWTAADTACSHAAVDRVGSWRLPSVAEVRKLRAARRLRTGRYWIGGEEADGSVQVVASSGGSPASVAKTDTALTVCVRRRLAD